MAAMGLHHQNENIQLSNLLNQFSNGIAAFCQDLGDGKGLLSACPLHHAGPLAPRLTKDGREKTSSVVSPSEIRYTSYSFVMQR
jgi:hypothetical protein